MYICLDKFKITKVNAPYPVGFIDDFLDNNDCKKLYDEIKSFDKYDDLVMSGRHRVNKGSQKFYNYLNKSPNLSSLYEKLNNKDFFLSMKDKLDTINQNNVWTYKIDNFIFSKENYGEQSFSIVKYLRKNNLIASFFKKTLNLDIDFSISKKGYFREAHRDRCTRVISFLIYLNTIKKGLGGEFEVYKSNSDDLKNLKRFPNKNDVTLVDKFSPKSGQIFIFLSTPNSYHGVSKFISNDQERVFIYGSYSLDRNVNWIKLT